jgi:LysM repeat protein
MIFSVKRASGLFVPFFALLLLLGCFGSGNSFVDEEKEPHFLEGKSRVSAMDYNGAVESYERALEVNPHSSAAHFQLGWLYDQKQQDPAAAIYHYAQYLRAHPEGANAERARACITACKQELAKTVALAPVTQNLQKELETLTEENKKMKEELEQWRAYYKSTGGSAQNGAAGTPPDSAARLALASPRGANTSTPSPRTVARSASDATTAQKSAAATPSKTYTVQAGDTPAAIAKRYGIKLDALLTANPRLDPKRMRPGQSLNLPAP